MPALPYSLNGANTRLVDDQYVSPLRLKDIEIKGIMNATGRRIGHPQVGISWCLLNHARDFFDRQVPFFMMGGAVLRFSLIPCVKNRYTAHHERNLSVKEIGPVRLKTVKAGQPLLLRHNDSVEAEGESVS